MSLLSASCVLLDLQLKLGYTLVYSKIVFCKDVRAVHHRTSMKVELTRGQRVFRLKKTFKSCKNIYYYYFFCSIGSNRGVS